MVFIIDINIFRDEDSQGISVSSCCNGLSAGAGAGGGGVTIVGIIGDFGFSTTGSMTGSRVSF